jgi:hypothetical protein
MYAFEASQLVLENGGASFNRFMSCVSAFVQFSPRASSPARKSSRDREINDGKFFGTDL